MTSKNESNANEKSTPSLADITFRKPRVEDGKEMWRIGQASPPLDVNSQYSYLLLGTHFRDTCVVGEADGRVVSFLSAYKPPSSKGTLFVWQVAVDEDYRRMGVAVAMMQELFGRDSVTDVSYLEATVTPDNKASRKFFASLAETLGIELEEHTLFQDRHFAGGDHEPEVLLSVGPFTPNTVDLDVDFDEEGLEVFNRRESEVRSYVRSFPTVFSRAEGSCLFDESGERYLDFFAGAGVLNYGHNDPDITEALIDYLQGRNIVHALDKATVAKRDFIETLDEVILRPRGLDYKIQFSGPTGTNAVETALKLARMIKGTSNVIAFTNGFHGLTMGSLSVTGNDFYRDESFTNRSNVAFMPFANYFGPDVDTIDYLKRYLEDSSSGVDDPAAVIVETIQAEGGVNVAGDAWLKKLATLCKKHGILLIVDDIQVGNGRTGTFFSFEHAGIKPDIVTVSKSLGAGLPISLVLMDPELDRWKPGMHTGTFRGNNLAFVAARAAFDKFWRDDSLMRDVRRKSAVLDERLQKIRKAYPELKARVRGRGLIYGLGIPHEGFAGQVSQRAFEKNLILELCGPDNNVVKFLPPLVISDDELAEGLDIVEEAVGYVAKKEGLHR